MLSNTATPKYYGQFRQDVLSGKIKVNENIELQMNLIDNNNQTGGNGFNFAGMATDILSGVLGNSKTQAITNPSSTYSQFKMPTTNFKVDMKL